MQRAQVARWLLAGAALVTVGGCLVVTPLDELPRASSGGHGGNAGRGGSSAGSAPNEGGAGGESAGSAGSAGNSGGTGGKTGNGPCTTNAECVARNSDEPAICRASDHTCVVLATPECPLAYGNAADPNAIVFGAFATLDPAAPEDNSIVWAHRLALEELTGDDVDGLPGVGKTRRPLVMSVCNNADDVIKPGLSHLIDELQVPAVIGTLKPGDLRRAYVDNPTRDVFYLSPVSVTKSVVALEDADHIWNMLGQPSDFAPTYAALLALSEAHVRALQTEEQKKIPLRVALVTTNDAFDSELAGAVTPVIEFNGKSAADNGSSFTSVTIGSKPNFAQLADELAAWGPDIVISTAGDPFLMTNGLQQLLEEDWGGIQPSKTPPFYILSPYDAGNLNELLRRVSARIEIEPKVDHNERYVGVSIASAADNTLQNAYGIALRSKFKNAIVDTANYYDAVYFMAYAMVGANQPTGLTGTGIAAGMQRLMSGDPLNVGPGQISDAFPLLAGDKSTLHLLSTMGPPDFDAKTGVRAVDGGVFCFKRTQNSAQLVPDALRYDRAGNKLTGKPFPCISGFFQP